MAPASDAEGFFSFGYGVDLDADAAPNGAWCLALNWADASDFSAAPVFGYLASADYDEDVGLVGADSDLEEYEVDEDEEGYQNYEVDPEIDPLALTDISGWVAGWEIEQVFYLPAPLIAPADVAVGSTADEGDRLDTGTSADTLYAWSSLDGTAFVAVAEECGDAELTGAATLAAAGTAALALALSI